MAVPPLTGSAFPTDNPGPWLPGASVCLSAGVYQFTAVALNPENGCEGSVGFTVEIECSCDYLPETIRLSFPATTFGDGQLQGDSLQYSGSGTLTLEPDGCNYHGAIDVTTHGTFRCTDRENPDCQPLTTTAPVNFSVASLGQNFRDGEWSVTTNLFGGNPVATILGPAIADGPIGVYNNYDVTPAFITGSVIYTVTLSP